MNKMHWVGLLLALTQLCGCATNAMTGRSQFNLVSESAAINQGSQLYSSMVDSYGKKGKISDNEAINLRVKSITNRLVEQAVLFRPDARKWKWQVSVIEEDSVNASCLPGGKMVVYTGLLDKVQPTDDELAQVMGHEISHALANHGAEKMSMQMIANIAIAAVSVAAASSSNSSRQNQQVVQGAAGLASAALITLPNSRNAESEADKLGVELAARAGYAPEAAISLWKKMMEQTGDKSKVDFLSTHPAPENRIASLQALQPPMQRIYDDRKAMYANYVPGYDYVRLGKENAPEYSSNVRIVTGDPKRDAEQATALEQSAEPGKALVFYSPRFEEFKQGTLELKCTNCSFSFYNNQSDLKKLFDKQDWRMLAQSVIKQDYVLDLSYFYLAAAAEGMGMAEAARIYYGKALELSASADHACAKGTMIKCQGLDVTALANGNASK